MLAEEVLPVSWKLRGQGCVDSEPRIAQINTKEAIGSRQLAISKTGIRSKTKDQPKNGCGVRGKGVMGRRILSMLLLVGALLLWFAWITGRLHQPFVLTVAVLLFVAGGLLFPRTYEVVQRIRPLIGKKVGTEAWGRDLPEYTGATFRFHRALAFGAGLHLYLAPFPAGEAIHLKVAQPRDVIVNENGVEIGNAKYVQWQGRKLKRIAGQKALVLRMV